MYYITNIVLHDFYQIQFFTHTFTANVIVHDVFVDIDAGNYVSHKYNAIGDIRFVREVSKVVIWW